MFRPIILALAATALTGAAFAQQTTPAPQGIGAAAALAEVENEAMQVPGYNVNVDEFEDTDIFDATGDRVGEVDEVLMSADGRITAVAAEVGGFLGIGEKEVVIQLDQLRRDGDRVVIDMTRSEVEALPAWDD